MNIRRSFIAAAASLAVYVVVGASALAGQQPDVAPSTSGAHETRRTPTWTDTYSRPTKQRCEEFKSLKLDLRR